MTPTTVLADEFFMVAHHDVSGRSRLSARTCGIGLAAALLAELVFARRLRVTDGRVEACAGPPLADALSAAVWAQIEAEPEYAAIHLRLKALGTHAYDYVAHRLWQAGGVRREVSGRRWLGRETVTWVPTDWNRAAWAWMRLSTALQRGERLNNFDAFLAGLMAAVELRSLLLHAAPPEAHASVDRLPETVHPSLRELLNHATAALGNAVLSHRV
jgi:hypothetical protein